MKKGSRPDIRMRFGFAVKDRREALGLTQEEFADRAGLHRTYLSDIERGTRNVSLINIERLASALALKLSELFHFVEQTLIDFGIAYPHRAMVAEPLSNEIARLCSRCSRLCALRQRHRIIDVPSLEHETSALFLLPRCEPARTRRCHLPLSSQQP